MARIRHRTGNTGASFGIGILPVTFSSSVLSVCHVEPVPSYTAYRLTARAIHMRMRHTMLSFQFMDAPL
jgi:hypothetical protein